METRVLDNDQVVIVGLGGDRHMVSNSEFIPSYYCLLYDMLKSLRVMRRRY